MSSIQLELSMRATTRIRNANKTKQVRWFQYLHVIHSPDYDMDEKLYQEPPIIPFIEIYGRPSKLSECVPVLICKQNDLMELSKTAKSQ